MDEPWTKRIVALVLAGSTAGLFHKNNFTSPLLVQCSAPVRRMVISFMNGPFWAWLLGAELGGKPAASECVKAAHRRLIQGRQRWTYNVFCAAVVPEEAPGAARLLVIGPSRGGYGAATPELRVDTKVGPARLRHDF